MENQNPYAAPATLGRNPIMLPEDGARLLEIAKAQRGLMLCILGYLVSVVLILVLGQKVEWLAPAAGLLFLASALGGLVFLIILTYRLSGVVLAVVFGFCFLIPLVGLLLMLLMSGKASRQLKQAGFKIGLLGADIGQIRKAIAVNASPHRA